MSVYDEEPLRTKMALEVEAVDSLIAIDFLLDNVDLSKSRLKDIMNKGAVWLKRAKKPRQRVRRAMTDLKIGDIVEVYYDDQLLSLRAPQLIPVADSLQYSIWNKPAGMLIEGNDWSDHVALQRIVAMHFRPPREALLVHRLDREAAGLVIMAHDKKTGLALSELFRDGEMKMQYRIEVRGNLVELGKTGEIDYPLDGHDAHTRYHVVRYSTEKDFSVVDVWLGTGRKHQIRRHFEHIGFPVMGDPKYGQGNKNHSGMKLQAVSMSFACPITQKSVNFSIFDKSAGAHK